MNKATLTALATALCASMAQAGVTIGYDDGGPVLFRVAAPDGWLVNTGFTTSPDAMPDGRTPTPRIVSLQPPEDDLVMWAGLWSPPQLDSIDDGFAYLDSLRLDLLEAPRITDEVTRKVAGMPARVISGEGLRDGLAFRFDVAMVQIAPNRVAVAAFIGEPNAKARYAQDLADILGSMQGVAP